jgi:hypothetical protein
MARRLVRISNTAGSIAASTAVILIVSSSPAAAHVVESRKTSAWAVGLAIGGAVAAISGILASLAGRRKPGLGIFVAGIVLLSVAMSGFSLDSAPRSSPTQVKIVEPSWGATVSNPVRIKVDLVNGSLVPLDRTSGPPTEGHLHIYANGRAVGMFDDTEEEIELPPGRYVLQVEFTGADHKSFTPFVADTVEVEVVETKST